MALLYDYLGLGEMTFFTRLFFQVLPLLASIILIGGYEAREDAPQPKTLYDGLDRLEEDDDADI